MRFETLAPGLKHRDTADWETPAIRATSYDVARRPSGKSILLSGFSAGLSF
jgi:hypothetical protein